MNLGRKVVQLKKAMPMNDKLYTDARKVVAQHMSSIGGKRRTMKVKKHFRNTKKRNYKKVKKTRLRRNNKSKRVLKEKRRR
jgi:hypothetical protein